MKPLTQRALLATAVWAAVSAQTASAQLEEVLVTAERREANLQDTPISITTFSDQEIIDRGINSADDLNGKILGVSAGTTNEKALKAYIEENNLDTKVVEVKDHSQGWLALETNRIDAYGSDDDYGQGFQEIGFAGSKQNRGDKGEYNAEEWTFSG